MYFQRRMKHIANNMRSKIAHMAIRHQFSIRRLFANGIVDFQYISTMRKIWLIYSLNPLLTVFLKETSVVRDWVFDVILKGIDILYYILKYLSAMFVKCIIYHHIIIYIWNGILRRERNWCKRSARWSRASIHTYSIFSWLQYIYTCVILFFPYWWAYLGFRYKRLGIVEVDLHMWRLVLHCILAHARI